uniref:Uncharacterized protein n=1 Tax=Anguilla anguilla TaxID=7936 RepID=A0A0E9WE09_ANGAN
MRCCMASVMISSCCLLFRNRTPVEIVRKNRCYKWGGNYL